MAEQSIQTITVDADPARVMAVIADFPEYPQWAGAVKKIEVLADGPGGRAERVRFVIDAGIFRDTYELAYTWAGDRKVEWRLISGQMQKEQEGSYTLEPVAEGTEVTYALSVELAMPMLGMMKRKAERMIMDTALKDLKRRVEGDSE
ncbi:MAG: SRPBCC family protein [Actinomycetia bacterium]|nr:SRPBCC family protein [Actinomycetes bacterium]